MALFFRFPIVHRTLIYFAIFLKAELFTFGVALGVAFDLSPLKGESDALLPALSIFPQSRCAAGVRPADTRGLLGNFGTGVLSTFPVIPNLAEVRRDSEILSTIRW